ncbi:hypothetical protein DRQ33_01110 [bacterium]|nr:MAG: hypothetical protein DRQ33_01110 [bacterium]
MRKYMLLLLLAGIIFADSGFAYLQIINNGVIFSSDYRGTGIYSITDTVRAIGEPSRVRGRHSTIWKNEFILFKKIDSSGQTPCIYHIISGRIYELLDANPSVGVPQPLGDSLLIPLGDKVSIWKGNAILGQIPVRNSIQWITVDTVNARFAYIDDDGYLVIVNIADGSSSAIFPSLGYKPVWNPDGSKIALTGSNGIVVMDLQLNEFYEFADGRNFVWDTEPNRIVSADAGGIFVQVTFDHQYRVDSSEIWYWVPGAERYNITNTSELHEAMPAISPDGKFISFISIPDGDIYRAQISIGEDNKIQLIGITQIADGQDCPVVPYRKGGNDGTKTDLWVPYLHQKYDVPDYFNGSASCGPTSGLMAIQRYDKLPPHPITCSYPYTHTHDFGWYVPNEYEYNGYVYDHPGLAPKVGDYYSDTTVYGAHGFCTSPTDRVGTYGDSLVLLIQQHGLYSGWSSYSPPWSLYQGEIDSNDPMCALLYFGSSGHYNCWRGYFTDHCIIANDPYGDYNTSPWGQYNGEMAYYDWPGYDNGNYSPTVRYLFYARGDYIPPPADTIVDDLSAGFSANGPGNYWRAWLGGYDNHAFWTGSVLSGDDVNFATWTPILSSTGEYQIYVYIPSNYATAQARYQIHHSGTVDTVIVNQASYSNEWVSLGTYFCEPGDYVYLGDVTGASGDYISCDAVWFSPLGSGIIVDDGDPEFNTGGTWNVGSYPDSGWYSDYLWANALDTVDDWATWTPYIPDSGVYDVYMWWMPAANRCDSVFVRIMGAYNDSMFVSQSTGITEWHYLGRFLFHSGSSGYVGLSDRSATDGDVIIADAVRWIYIGNVDTLIDDYDDGFHRYADPAFWHDGTGGYDDHFWWTYSTESVDTCYVEWYPILPRPGEYEVLVYIPDNHATANARYRIFHSDGEDTMVVNQASYFNQWVSLGNYNFSGSSSEKVYLGDATGIQGNYIAFDAVWWRNIALDVAPKHPVPTEISISAYPNPFNSACVLDIVVPVESWLQFYDITGNKIDEISVKSGISRIIWRPENIGSGIYFAKLSNSIGAIKILYIK